MPRSSGQVIYLPSQRRETLGSDIGGLIGSAIVANMKMEEDKKEMAEQKLFVESIRLAPNRAAAFEVVANRSFRLRKPEQYTAALRTVDEMHPLSEETPTPLAVYSAATGEPTTIFPTRKDMAKSSYWKEQEEKGYSLVKPDVEDFYKQIVPPSSPTADANKKPGEVEEPLYGHIGKLPVSRRPEGAVTLPELTLARQARTEARTGRGEVRADEAAERADKRMGISEQRLANAEARTAAVIGRLAESLGNQDVQRGQATVQSAIRLAAISMNAKTLPDGTWDFGGNVDKAEQFTKMVDYINTRVDANPKMLKSPTAASRLFTEARRSVLGAEGEKPKPEPEIEKPKGIKEKVSEAVSKVGERPGMTPTETRASITAARAAATRVRDSTTMTAEEKKAALATIRERLADANIAGDI